MTTDVALTFCGIGAWRKLMSAKRKFWTHRANISPSLYSGRLLLRKWTRLILFEAEEFSCSQTQQIIDIAGGQTRPAFKHGSRIRKSSIRVWIIAANHQALGADAFDYVRQSRIVRAQ